MRKRLYVETYGCWLNKADTNIMIQEFLRRGYVLVSSPEEADVILINTCAVRGDSEVRQLKRMRELASRLRDKFFVVAGCLAKIKIREIQRIFNKCIIVDPNSVEDVDKVVSAVERGEAGRVFLSEDRPMCKLPDYIPELHGHIYVVPVQVGCLCSCTFCVTKIARQVSGRVKSYPLELIVEHVKRAVKRGAREIYITGQDVACYGFDRGYTLVELLERILREVEGTYFIRIGMSEPEAYSKIVDQILDLMKSDERIYRYFHIPVQSGSDKILRLMRRRYTVDEYRELVRKIRKTFPEACIVTDMIVGFPGETEEDFELSLKLILELEFDKVHVARFSPRPFTEAEIMERQVPDRVKKERSRRMVEIANAVSLQRNKTFVGRVLRAVLSTPEPKGDGVVARLLNYKPVILKGVRRDLLSAVCKVAITDATPVSLRGELVEIEIKPSIEPARYREIAMLEEDAS